MKILTQIIDKNASNTISNKIYNKPVPFIRFTLITLHQENTQEHTMINAKNTKSIYLFSVRLLTLFNFPILPKLAN